jgi:serine/threonine protein phosphatase 1
VKRAGTRPIEFLLARAAAHRVALGQPFEIVRLLAIGDIHGHLCALDSLLEAVGLRDDDQLVFLGDYVDKGPNVKGVIDRLLEIATTRKAIFLRGNHDQMMADALRDTSKISVWECLGGEKPLASYGEGTLADLIRKVPAEHRLFLEEICADYFVTADYIFVHGGIRAHVEPFEEDRERLLWTTLSLAERHASGRTVICGHSSQRSGAIADLGHTICIDTGITRAGWLTCLALDTFEFWQATPEGNCRSGRLAGRGQ